jgi:hypothetical protein
MIESEKSGHRRHREQGDPPQSTHFDARRRRRARNTRILVESVVTALLGVIAGKLAGAITGSSISSGAIGGAVGGMAGLLFLRREKKLTLSKTAEPIGPDHGTRRAPGNQPDRGTTS